MAATESTPGEMFAAWPTVDAQSEPSGWIAAISRSLGMRDGDTYTEELQTAVRARKRSAGLADDPTVSGATWGLFMPALRLGDVGGEVALVRARYGLSPGRWFDQELATALGSEILDSAGWVVVAGLETSSGVGTVTENSGQNAEPDPENSNPEQKEAAA